MRRISEVARDLQLPEEAWAPYGHWIAKVDPSRLASLPPKGAVVLITGMTPTSKGVGKTVTMLGLASGLRRIGIRAVACLRQPSMGPVFGIKGGGAGGGQATVEPFLDVNLGLTGDMNAVVNAHNLLASLLDNHLHFGNELGIAPETIAWPRTLDLEDRPLRQVQIGLGQGNSPVRGGNFLIAPASEITALLGLASGAGDLRARLGRLTVARNKQGDPVTAQDLKAAGAMAVLLRDAIKPNLLQTPEGAPVLVHGGPFGNLSYGTTTAAAIQLGRSVADIVLVEAGFGTDLGGEKFVDLVGPLDGFAASTAVLVVSLPVLRAHGGTPEGAPTSLVAGLENLQKHLENLQALGLRAVVALNRFPGDTPGELAMVRDRCASLSAPCIDNSAYAQGGAGCEELARAVGDAARKGGRAQPLYSFDVPMREKIDRIVRTLYGGDGADISPEAEAALERPLGMPNGQVPVCLAKTPLSLSDDPKKLGRPRDFRVKVREVVSAPGAGYVVALLGDILTMPGLPRNPKAAEMDLRPDGTVVGVS